jgi:acyl-homoserine lactone acylase PvdQ
VKPRAVVALTALALLVGGLAGVAPATAAGEGQYLVHDAGLPQNVRNILPAGEAGTVSIDEMLHHEADPTWFPPHINDQLPLYDGPTFTPAGKITPVQMQQFSKEETFGVADGKIESIETPPGKPGLMIIRDNFGVPHIFATSRSLAKYGVGWVSAEDRLFMMDVLRHAGRGNLAALIGSSGYDMDCGTHYSSGYDDADAQAQMAYIKAHDPQLVADAQDFADGVNGWISSPGFFQHMPVEYNAFPKPIGPALPLGVGNSMWTPVDTGAVAVLIGAQLGSGGGAEVANTMAYRNLLGIYGNDTAGQQKARSIFDDLHAANDPESPTTIDQSFPYESRAQRDPASVALINSWPSDNGCNHTGTPSPPTVGVPILPHSTPVLGSGGMSSTTRDSIRQNAVKRASGIVTAVLQKKHASNATVVNADHAVDGHPIADFGSQAAYWMPEIFMEMDVHAPDWDARGFQFPGTGVVVELGRGQDFAWSATSAGSDNIDERADVLCNPNPLPGDTPLSKVDPNSTYYWYKGNLTGGVFKCLPMIEKQLQYYVPPSGGTLPNIPPNNGNVGDVWTGIETFKVERTTHDDGTGIVQGRTTAVYKGQRVNVAVTSQRTNFFHELDQASGFEKWNSPSQVHDAASFIKAAAEVDTTFNWFYVDAHHTAYYTSGKLPLRNPAADPDLLNWGTGEWDWQGILPPSMHPQAIDPPRGWMTSWNNRPAPNFGSSDANWDYGPLYRSQLLDRTLTQLLAAGGGKVSATDLFNVMQVASVTDHRAQRLLDEIFAIVNSQALSPAEQANFGPALAAMAAWHTQALDARQDTGHTGTYAHADGISYFDAFYPHLINLVYNKWFGTTGDQPHCNGTFTVPGDVPKTFDNPPSDGHCYGDRDWAGVNVGSAYDGGWQDALDKDFRQVLGAPVTAPHQNTFCGGGHAGANVVQGSLATCRREVLAALTEGIAQHQTNYVALTANDKMDYRSLGLFTLAPEQWANKPTQQQFVEFVSDRTSFPDASTARGALPNTAAGSGAVVLLLIAATAVPLVAGARRRRRRD